MPFIEHDGETLHFETFGPAEAPPVVLLHDVASDLRAWIPAARELAQDFAVVLPDLRGHGLSGWPAGTLHVAIDEFTGDLEALLDDRGIDLAAVGGTGFGGAVALRFALGQPARVAALVIDGPVTLRDGASSSDDQDRPVWEEPLALGRRAAQGVRDDYLGRGLIAKYRSVNRDALAGAIEAWRTADLGPDVTARVGMPVMLIEGETPHELAEAFPEARRVRIRGAGRDVAATRASAVATEIARFFLAIEEGRPVVERVTL